MMLQNIENRDIILLYLDSWINYTLTANKYNELIRVSYENLTSENKSSEIKKICHHLSMNNPSEMIHLKKLYLYRVKK